VSALWAPAPERDDQQTAPRSRSRLRSVPPPSRRLARFPFLLVMMGIFGFGMAGLLMLNTTLQNQAFEARTLERQATELAYTQSDLENQLTILAAPQELARRASILGMRPNPYPALLVVPGGKVLGKASPVAGGEVPSLIVKTDAELAAEKAAAAAKQKADAERAAIEAKAKAEEAKRKAAEEAAKKKAEAEIAKKQAAEAKKADAKKPTTKKPTTDKPTAKKPATKKNDGGER